MIKGVIFDFYETLIEADIKAPSAWECLNQMGYNSSLSLQSQWESDAFDGQLTPSLNDYPSYHDWLLNNFKEFAKSSGVRPFLSCCIRAPASNKCVTISNEPT